MAGIRPSGSPNSSRYRAAAAAKTVAGRRRPPPGRERVGLAHRPEVAHQGERVGPSDDDGVAVGDGEREARALKQRPAVADIGERRDARTRAARDFALRLQQDAAEFVQGLSAEAPGEEKPVRDQNPASLHQHARQVVHRVQAQGAQHEIEARRREGDGLLVCDDRNAGAIPHQRLGRIANDDSLDPGPRGDQRA